MKKTLVSLLVVLALLISCVPTLAEGEAPIKLRIAAIRNAQDQTESFNDKEVVQRLCEAANVEVEWIEVLASAVSERKSVLLASDLPDAFFGILSVDDITLNTDLFLPLNDLLEQYAPNVCEQFDSMGDGVWNLCTWPDGNIYTLPVNLYSFKSNTTSACPVINQRWLDNVGMAMPTTLDELYNVLKAFKEQDANGNGDPNDEIPLSFNGNFIFFGGSWGFTDYCYRIEDGKVIGVAAENEYREFIEFYHKLVEEGLVDVEAFSQTGEQWSAKFKGDKLGITWCWRPGTDCAGADCEKDWVTYRPVYAEGCEGRPSIPGCQTKFTGNQVGITITTACEHPEAILNMWNIASSSIEWKMALAEGTENVTWGHDDAGNVTYINFIDPEIDTESLGRGWWKYNSSLCSDIYPLILPDEAGYYPTDAEDPQARINLVNDVWDLVPTAEQYMPNRIIEAEYVEERTMIEPDLMNYIHGFVANSVLNGLTDEEWEAHLAQLERYSYGEYIDWWQKYYDGNF